MKTTSLPAVRVSEALRAAAEDVLAEGESLSSLIEESLRRAVEHRQIQAAFVARAAESRAETERTGVLYPAAQVHAEMRAMTAARRKQLLG
jgi:hypothetical protein